MNRSVFQRISSFSLLILTITSLFLIEPTKVFSKPCVVDSSTSNITKKTKELKNLVEQLSNSAYEEAKSYADSKSSPEAIKQAFSAQYPYKLSITLLGSAQLKLDSLYQVNLTNMLEALGIDSQFEVDSLKKYAINSSQPLSYATWLLARVVKAADSINDQATASKAAQLLENSLNDSTITEDAFNAWAWAYLAEHWATIDRSHYDLAKEKMLQITAKLSPKDGISNLLWALVMDLSAAAKANDTSTYRKLVTDIKKVMSEKRLVAALQAIPVDDFRAWALSISYQAAKTIKDRPRIICQLKHATLQALKDPKISLADSLLAREVLFLSH